MSTPQPLNPLTLPLHGETLIEASAGTGKTFTIALLYVRLVLGHGQPPSSALADGLLPPSLLVVTFTDAATKELRDRIRSRLTQAAAVFSEAAPEPTPATELLYQLRDQYYPDPASWPGCQQKLLLAAEWMDEAAVSTIHGWCHRMLSEHAFDSGSLFHLRLETDLSDLLEQAVQDYWRTFVYPLEPAAMRVWLQYWQQPEALQVSVKSLLAKPLPVPEADSLAAILQQQAQALQAQVDALKAHPWQQWQEEVSDLLAELHQQKRLHGGSKNAMLNVWDDLVAWSQGEEMLPPKLERAGFGHQTPDGLAAKVKGELPEHPAFNAIDELLVFANNIPDARPALLSHACAWLKQRLELEKQQRAAMGFDDLLTRLDEALQGPRGEQLAATIRRQFPVALIDEFQDTDPVQYRIFATVYGQQEGTGLLMIGDPKQAIYGFRGADIFTYLKARQSAAGSTYTLATNYRSANAMVAATNQLFQQADEQCEQGAFLFGQGASSELPFQPVLAHGSARSWCIDGQAQPSLTVWQQLSDSDKALNKGEVQQSLALSCASEIARLLTLGQQQLAGFEADADNGKALQPLQPQDIAILVNNRSEAHSVRHALQTYGVKSVYLSDRNSVLTTVEALDLLSWLAACAEPQRLSALRAALATPTLGLSLQQLDALLTDEQVLETTIERFIGYQRQWQRHGVLPMLRSLLMDYDVAAKLLASDDGERRLADILHLAELLQQDSQQLDGEHALLHHYRQLLQHADSEDEHRILRLESDASLVKVVTVHKSKGLEYPLVFLPFACQARPLRDKASFVQFHDQQRQLQLRLQPTDDDIERADQERLGEDIRKLYVALTRARYATWVGAAEVKDWQHSALGYLLGQPQRLGEGLAALEHAPLEGASHIRVEDLPSLGDDVYRPQHSEALGPALTSRRSAREDWWIASYSALEYTAMAGTGRVFRPELEDPHSQNILLDDGDYSLQATQPAPAGLGHAFVRGASAGTFLHDMLEWCAGQGFEQVIKQPELLAVQLQRRCASRGWQAWQPMLQRWLPAVLQTPLPLPQGAVSLAELQHYQAEMEFWFASEQVALSALDDWVVQNTLNQADRPRIRPGQLNGMLKGFIDLVFEHEGRFYVLDYKSNYLGEDDSAYSAQAMGEMILTKRYDLQYMLYLLALHRLLKARLPDYDYDRHIGGAVYLFLRGIQAPTAGVFADKPARQVIEQLDALFMGDKTAVTQATTEEKLS